MPTTPRGFPLITADQKYALVDDYNKLATKADAEATVTEARAQEVADAAKAYALDVSTRSADRAMEVATNARAAVAPVRDLVDSANAKADQAVSTADAAYRYNQSLTGALPEQIDAVLADGQSDAGQRLLQRVHVRDTYVGVTQQPGATMKDKLHAACAEATRIHGTVMLPSTPIDVGTGFSMAGYSCGIVGQGRVGVRRPVALPAYAEGSGLVASQQDGPVLDFRGYQWANAYEGQVIFEGFHLRGNDVVDTTRTNVGLNLAQGPSPDGKYTSLHSGAGLVKFDIAISGCGGGGIYTQAFYFSRSRFVVSAGTGTGAANIPAAIFDNATGVDVDLYVFSPESNGAQVAPADGVVAIKSWERAGKEPVISADGRWNILIENFWMQTDSTLVYLQGHMNSVELRIQDILPVPGTVERTSGVKLAPRPSHATLPYHGNTVHGTIPGRNGPITFTHPVWVQESGCVVTGTRRYGAHSVVIDPGVVGTFVNLRGYYSKPTTPGIVDNSGKPGENTLRDFTYYPLDGKNPTPKRLDQDTSVSGSTNVPLHINRLAPSATYRFTAEMQYTASTASHALFGVWGSGDVNLTSWTLEGTKIGQEVDTVSRRVSSGVGSLSLAGTGTRAHATITGTFTTSPTTDAVDYIQVFGSQRTSDTSTPMIVHAGSILSVERIA